MYNFFSTSANFSYLFAYFFHLFTFLHTFFIFRTSCSYQSLTHAKHSFSHISDEFLFPENLHMSIIFYTFALGFVKETLPAHFQPRKRTWSRES